MDMAAALGMAGLGLGALSIVLGFLGVQQGMRTDRILASEADKTRNLVTEMRESTQALIASEADKTRNLISEMRENTQALIGSEGDKTRSLVTELHESTKTFVAALSAEHAEILNRLAPK